MSAICDGSMKKARLGLGCPSSKPAMDCSPSGVRSPAVPLTHLHRNDLAGHRGQDGAVASRGRARVEPGQANNKALTIFCDQGFVRSSFRRIGIAAEVGDFQQ